MRKQNLKIEGEALSRLKVLAAQLDKSPESAVEFLLDVYDEAVEQEFQDALDAYHAQRLEEARTSMARIKKRFKK